MKEILKLLNKFFVLEVLKETSLPLDIFESIRILVIKIEVKSEVAIPIRSVVAKPLIGPVPNINNMNAVKPVVMFASRIEDKAFEKPSETDFICPLPFLNSSFILSKINTLASTDIPIVNTIPAIPGKVKTAPKPASIPKINKIFNTKAMFAKIPDDP